MKAIFIAFDQAYYERIVEMLHKSGCRGFTAFNDVVGRGSHTGDPHYGTHAWPSLVQGILTVVEDKPCRQCSREAPRDGPCYTKTGT